MGCQMKWVHFNVLYACEQIFPNIANLQVGKNLQDHMGAFGLSWTIRKKKSAYSLLPLFNPITLKEYTLKHTGKNMPENKIIRSFFPMECWPDLYVLCILNDFIAFIEVLSVKQWGSKEMHFYTVDILIKVQIGQICNYFSFLRHRRSMGEEDFRNILELLQKCVYVTLLNLLLCV